MKVSINDKACIKLKIRRMYKKRETNIIEDRMYYLDNSLSDVRFCFDLLAASLTQDSIRKLYEKYNDVDLYLVTNEIVRELIHETN